MSATADNKKYSTDNRLFGDAVRQDGIHPSFLDSPITARTRISDICVYKPGDLNKIGKEGKTSWDSFSYALLMGHNVWMHLEAVQQANREFDSGNAPGMLVHNLDQYYDAALVINRVFAAHDRQKSLQIIDDHAKIWERIIGTRGYTGHRAISARPTFNQFFDFDDESLDSNELNPQLLEQLEDSIDV